MATVVATQAMAAGQCARTDLPPRLPQWSVKECPRTCVVTHDPGGLVREFKSQAYILKGQGRRLVIDGFCASACTIGADLARPNVCITPKATFHFHKGYRPSLWPLGREIVRVDLSDQYSTDIRRWIALKGGLPGKDACDNSLLDMSNAEARQFFPMCSES